MKRPLFDIITTAHTGDDGCGGFDVRIVSRYGATDGQSLGGKQDVSMDEAMEFATGAVDAFFAGVMNDRSN